MIKQKKRRRRRKKNRENVMGCGRLRERERERERERQTDRQTDRQRANSMMNRRVDRKSEVLLPPSRRSKQSCVSIGGVAMAGSNWQLGLLATLRHFRFYPRLSRPVKSTPPLHMCHCQNVTSVSPRPRGGGCPP